MTADGLLTYDGAAELLRLRPSVLRRAAARRELRVIRMGHRTVRIRRVDLDKWLQSCRVEAIC